MMKNRKFEIGTGIFILLAILAILFLSFRVASQKSWGVGGTWTLYARFDNVGAIKAGSPVRVGGVVVGRVTNIALDNHSYLPRVTMEISDKYRNIPDTSALAIRTQGILGEQFLALTIGFDDPDLGTTMLKEGETLKDTKSALVFEDLIGQFLYKGSTNSNENKEKNTNDSHSDFSSFHENSGI